MFILLHFKISIGLDFPGGNLQRMPNSNRQLALSSLLAVLLYLMPNLVQDIHRVFGKHEYHVETISQTGNQIHIQYEKCSICVFEFNVADDIVNPVFLPLQNTVPFLLSSKQENQIQNKAFYYYNLRAPPQA
jgi:hypothetical protein